MTEEEKKDTRIITHAGDDSGDEPGGECEGNNRDIYIEFNEKKDNIGTITV